MTQRDPNHRRPSRPPAMPPPIPAAARIPVAPSPSMPAAPPEPVPIVVAPTPARRRQSEASASYGADPAADWRLLAGGAAVGLLIAAGLFAAYLASLPPSPIVVPPSGFAEQIAAIDVPAWEPSMAGSSQSGGEPAGTDPPPDSPAVSPISEPRGPSPEELAAEQRRMAEEAIRREQESQSQGRREAFGRLRQRLDQARHLPLKADVILENRLEQTTTLCQLDGADVEVSLPKLPKIDLVPGKPWQLQCTATAGNACLIVATPGDAAGGPIEIGRVEAKQEELVLTLLEMPAVRDPLWVAAREAVITAPLVLRLPGEKSREFETFVQPCMPKRLDPIRLEKVLTDRSWLPRGGKLGKVAEFGPLPGTPWPCLVEFRGKGPDGVSGAVATGSAARITTTATPLQARARWTWSGEPTQPFMETAFTLTSGSSDPVGTGGQPAVEIRVAEAKVLPPWNGWQRLGELKDSGNKNLVLMSQLPRPGEFRQPVPLTDEIPLGIFAEYSVIARQYVLKLSPKAVQDFFRGQQITRALEAWQGEIRSKLRATGGFKQWVDKVAPDPSGQSSNTSYSEELAMKDRRKLYLDAGEEVVAEYWRDLKGNPARHESEKDGVILCCLHFELQPVLQEKRKALKLLEAVGDGTVELTGRIWSDPVGDDRYKVLLAEFGPADGPQPLGRIP